MAEKTSTSWVIRSVQVIREKVVFDEAVTAEEAEDLYWEGEIADVLDSDIEDLNDVLSVESMDD